MLRVLLAMLMMASVATLAEARKQHRNRQLIHSACDQDIDTVCKALPAGHNVQTCLLAHPRQLSSKCVAAMHKASCNLNANVKLKTTFPCQH